jgi:hypothetical protein
MVEAERRTAYVAAAGTPDFFPTSGKGGLQAVLQDAFGDYLQQSPGDSRINSKFQKIWGNAAFEAENPASVSSTKPGQVRLNNLFDEQQQNVKQSDKKMRGAEEADESLAAAGDARSILANFFRKTQQTSAGQEEGSQTAIQAFDEEDLPEAMPMPPPPVAVQVKSVADWEVELKQMLSAGNLRLEAIQRAAPSRGLVRCYVKRAKGLFGGHCSFQLYLDNGDKFLLAARRRVKSKVSSYVISEDLEDLKRDSEHCISKLKANFVGSEYNVYGKSNDNVNKGFGLEQLCINYKGSSLKSSGPRSMHVMVPVPESDWQPSAQDGSDSLSNLLELAKIRELPPHMERNVAIMSTKAPEYSKAVKGYTLDFGGRVKEKSVKNFQLVTWDHRNDSTGTDIILQFGKVENDLYALDFAYPFSIHTAFSVALASLDTKLCYTV